VENYILASDRKRELGGYFYGTAQKFQAFLPAVNYSDTPSRSFQINPHGPHWSREFATMLGLPAVAGMHTHPSGAVASEGDRKYIQAHSLTYEVVIADQGERFRWFIIDRKLREVGLIESDEELDELSRLFHIELGLFPLGSVFLDEPNNTLVISSKIGRVLLSLDQDALAVYSILRDSPRYDRPTANRLKTLTGISAGRISRAIQKIKRGDVIENW
jgi:proteasome lid subunit RPN8/RPN11